MWGFNRNSRSEVGVALEHGGPGSGVTGARRPVERPVVAASVSETPACALLVGAFREPELDASPAVGVGHVCAAA